MALGCVLGVQKSDPKTRIDMQPPQKPLLDSTERDASLVKYYPDPWNMTVVFETAVGSEAMASRLQGDSFSDDIRRNPLTSACLDESGVFGIAQIDLKSEDSQHIARSPSNSRPRMFSVSVRLSSVP